MILKPYSECVPIIAGLGMGAAGAVGAFALDASVGTTVAATVGLGYAGFCCAVMDEINKKQ